MRRLADVVAEVWPVTSCSIPDHHIDPRRSAVFMARSVLRDIQNGVQSCYSTFKMSLKADFASPW